MMPLVKIHIICTFFSSAVLAYILHTTCKKGRQAQWDSVIQFICVPGRHYNSLRLFGSHRWKRRHLVELI